MLISRENNPFLEFKTEFFEDASIFTKNFIKEGNDFAKEVQSKDIYQGFFVSEGPV